MTTNHIYPNSDHRPFCSRLDRTSLDWLTTEEASAPLSAFDEPEQQPDDDADSLAADDDSPWDAFLPDDDELDPLPEPGDFWFDDD
jgi:hypothetical protein